MLPQFLVSSSQILSTSPLFLVLHVLPGQDFQMQLRSTDSITNNVNLGTKSYSLWVLPLSVHGIWCVLCKILPWSLTRWISFFYHHFESLSLLSFAFKWGGKTLLRASEDCRRQLCLYSKVWAGLRLHAICVMCMNSALYCWVCTSSHCVDPVRFQRTLIKWELIFEFFPESPLSIWLALLGFYYELRMEKCVVCLCNHRFKVWAGLVGLG